MKASNPALCPNDGFRAVMEFSSAKVLPLVWEVQGVDLFEETVVCWEVVEWCAVVASLDRAASNSAVNCSIRSVVVDDFCVTRAAASSPATEFPQ